MILKYENSEENYKTSYICLFLITQYIQILFFIKFFFGLNILMAPLNKIPRAATGYANRCS